jgi:hypothetical protein
MGPIPPPGESGMLLRCASISFAIAFTIPIFLAKPFQIPFFFFDDEDEPPPSLPAFSLRDCA